METDAGLRAGLIQYAVNGGELVTKGCRRHKRKPQTCVVLFTCAQYWDLATASRSLRMGWDCDTSGETAWMTAVNLEYGLIPAKHQEAAVSHIGELKPLLLLQKCFYCEGSS